MSKSMNPFYLLMNKIDHLRFWFILQQFEPADYVMDIGCGNHPQKFIQSRFMHYAVDPVITISDRQQLTSSHLRLIKADWAWAVRHMQWGLPVDTVVLMDVIEHIEKTEAERLLKETMWLKKQIVVFTPLGFMPQEDGEWNTHRSGWFPQDFKGWEQVHVFPYFHWCDFKGRVFDKPWSAILAVYK